MPPSSVSDDLFWAVLRGDADRVRGCVDPSGSEAPWALAWAAILDSDFATAETIAARDDSLGARTAGLLAATMRGRAPSGALDELAREAVEFGTDLNRSTLWAMCILGEAGMSAGRLEVAETIARHAVDVSAADDPLAIFALQTLARALLFQGRLTESTETIRMAEAHPGADRIGALQLVVAGASAYLSALADDRATLEARADEVEAKASDSPPSYLVRGAFVLSAYALAAAGYAERAAEVLLRGAGGPRLAMLQSVDRAYGYELLTAAALSSGDLRRARQWMRIASRSAIADESGMAGAALARSAARVAVAEGEPGQSAGHAAVAAALADDRAGHLDATRAHLLSATALLQDGDSELAQLRLQEAGVAATRMGAVSLTLLARRDLRSIGLRFAGADQSPMSLREREVAELMITGLSNADIARTLNVSERTVHSHVAAVLRAMGVPSRTALARVLEPPPVGDTAGLLTARQQDVAELVSRGYTNEGIARELGVSVKTVEKHLSDTFRRLDIDSRSALAARWAGRAS